MYKFVSSQQRTQKFFDKFRTSSKSINDADEASEYEDELNKSQISLSQVQPVSPQKAMKTFETGVLNEIVRMPLKLTESAAERKMPKFGQLSTETLQMKEAYLSKTFLV